MKKELIDVQLRTIYVEELTGTVNETITYLSHLVTEKYVGFQNYRLETPDAWHGEGSLMLVAQRKETDKEMRKREARAFAATKAAATKKVKQEIKDRKTLARLQKKYGKIE